MLIKYPGFYRPYNQTKSIVFDKIKKALKSKAYYSFSSNSTKTFLTIDYVIFSSGNFPSLIPFSKALKFTEPSLIVFYVNYLNILYFVNN